MGQDKIDVAPLRAGMIGVAHAHAWGKVQAINASTDMQLAGVFEPDVAEWDRWSGRHDIGGIPRLSSRDILEDSSIEVVFVETHPRDNLRWAREALDHGKHVHLDKAPAPVLNDLRAVLNQAADRGLCVQMGYQFRYNPAIELARLAVRDHWLGPVSRIHADIPTNVGAYADQRDTVGTYAGGIFFELGCHLLDLVILILGKPSGVWSTLRADARQQGEVFVDNTTAVLEYPNALAIVQAWITGPEPSRHRRFEIIGEQGVLLIEPIEPPSIRLYLSQPTGTFPTGWSSPYVKMRPRYEADIADFAACIRGDGTSVFGGEHDMAVHETLLRICGVST